MEAVPLLSSLEHHQELRQTRVKPPEHDAVSVLAQDSIGRLLGVRAKEGGKFLHQYCWKYSHFNSGSCL